MEIIENKLSFGPMSVREKTEDIVLHHAAAIICTVFDIHRWHKEGKGWSGIGYHFFVRKNGEIHRGRPINTVGAHAYGFNDESIGICFEGNFETEEMPTAQKEAGKALVAYLKEKYPTIKSVKGHRDLMATACPGKNFPFDEIANAKGSNKNSTTNKTTKKEVCTVNLSVIQFGAKGENVRALQILLIGRGYSCGSCGADGEFGTDTAKAVKKYQKANGLTVDAIVGRNTWTSLLGA